MKRGKAPARGKAPPRARAPAKGKAPPPVSGGVISQTFERYASGTLMDAEGIGRLANDLGVDPMSDLGLLAFIWKCGIQTPGQINREEFTRGMQAVQAENVDVLRNKIDQLRNFASNPRNADYNKFFRFCFQISRDPGKKVIDRMEISTLMELLIGNQFRWVGEFLRFLEVRDVKVLNLDQWSSFLEFCLMYPDSLDNYNQDDPWPVLIDEFVGHVLN